MMIPKSYKETEAGFFFDAHLGLTIQKTNPAIWVLGNPDGFGASLEVLAVDGDGDVGKALARAGQVCIADRKRAKVAS